MKNDRIRPGTTKASEAALQLLADQPRYESIQHQAVKVVGALYQARVVPDLALKLAIGRALLDIPNRAWPDGLLGHLIYGGLNRTTGAPAMTHMQKGEAPVSVTAASMLAQFFNYFTDDPVDMTAWPSEDKVAEVASWIETNSGFSSGITAEDLVGDPLTFLKKLRRALSENKTLNPSHLTERAIHDRVMGILYTPLAQASWETRLVIGDRRVTNRPSEQFRFGKDQRVGSDPATWTPTEISSPDWIIEYGLPRRAERPLRAWLATIRDPSWANIDGDRVEGQWVWGKGWDDVIRWLPTFQIDAGDQIVAPSSDSNTPDGMLSGLYRVFLFTQPADEDDVMAKALWPNPSDRQTIPDEFAYLRLCEALPGPDLKGRVTIHAGAYVIPATNNAAMA